MSSFDERLEQELAKLEEQKKKKKKNVSLAAGQYSYLPSYQEGDDIAPTKTVSDDDIAPVSGSRFGGTRRISGEREEAEERTWFQKGAFEDGYQFGDVTKAILGTAEDAIQDLATGAVGIVEKTIDAGAYLVGGAGKLFGADKFSDKVQKFIARDIINEEEFVKNRLGWGDAPMNQLWDLTMGPSEDNSVLGKKSDSLVQSGGQLAGTIGLQAVGVPWYVTSGTTSFGAGAEEAFNEDATYGEAGLSAAISAGAEILTEKLFGGSGLGEKGLINLDGLTKGISNKLVKTLVDFGIDMAAEGAEEVVSEFASNLGSALYKEENLGDLLFSEEAVDGYIESFIGGAVLSGGMNSVKAGSAVKSGRDYRTGLSANEEAVFNKEYEDRIAEAEKNGELSQKQKDKIYDEVMHDLENGGISTDTIEEVLGGETYKAYQDSVAAENETLKELAELYKGKDKRAELQAEVETFMQNSKSRKLKEKLSEEVSGLVGNERLMESYLERGRRGEAFSTDVTQYEERLRPAIQRAIDSGVMNNTRRTRELVETVARLEADLGTVFNFADNKKIAASPYAVEGKIVDGYVDNDGNITVNVQSPKALNFTVGHEITHVLQGTELGSKLDEVLTEYAKGRKAKDGKFENEYMERLYDVRQRYKTIDGYQGVEGFNKVKKEVSADLVGEYLFTDRDFISQLSVKNRNLFQRLWDEVKYLAKVATAGSKEARELERVKKIFEDAYRKAGEGGKAQSGTQYALSEYSEQQKKNWSNSRRIVVYDNAEQLSQFIKDSIENKTMDKKMYFGSIPSDFAEKIKADTGLDVENYNLSLGSYEIRKILKDHGDESKEAPRGQRAIVPDDFEHIADVVLNPQKVELSKDTYMGKPAIIFTGEYNGRMNVVAVVSDKRLDLFVQTAFVNIKKGNLSSPTGEQAPVNTPEANDGTVSNGNVPHSANGVKGTFSVSDSEGNALTENQQAYFKDSKMRDENGNLKVMYHGTTRGGFHVFDPNYSDDSSSLFFVDSNDVAASYSGTSEEYAARTFNTPKEMNRFLAEIGYEDYEVVGANGKYTLYYDTDDAIATSDSLRGIYEEFCDFAGVGEGEVNYKVYLNLTKPLEVDADGNDWNSLPGIEDNSQYEYIKIVEVGDAAGEVTIEYAMVDDPAPVTETVDLWKRFPEGLADKLGDMAPGESIEGIYANPATTREYAQYAKEHGYDGVIFKNIYDIGGYGANGATEATVAIAFDSNQVKSVANTNPTKDADIRYSVTDSDGRELSTAVQKRFANSKVVDENGNLKSVYHGTASGEFSIFDKAKGSVEGDFGSGFYFTDNEADVSEHYEGGGPDFDNKVARLAERIADEEDIDYDEAEERARAELYKGGHRFEVYLNIENPAVVGETILFDGESYREEYNEDDYDDYDDYIADVEQRLADDIENIVWEVEKNVDVYNAEGIAGVLYDAYAEGGIGIEELKAKINDLYLEDSEGNLVGNEVTRQIIESLGYDGIIDPTVSTKWNMNMEAGTTHYIVFKPNQIKSVTNENPTDNPDIHRSISEVGKDYAPTGSYNIYGNDVYLRQDDDIAPFRLAPETVAENATVEVPVAEDLFPDDLAPMAEDEREMQERLASFTDEDAPPEQHAESGYHADNMPLPKTAASWIAKEVREALGLKNNQMATVHKIIQEYSESEFPTRDELFLRVKEELGTYTETYEDVYLKHVQSVLRGKAVFVDEQIKNSIPDYADFRRRHFGKIRFSKTGLPVDVAYAELSGEYPTFFPESIIVPEDQLYRLSEIANRTAKSEAEYDIPDSDIWDVTDAIIEGVTDYKQLQKQKVAEQSARRAASSLDENALAPDETVSPKEILSAPVQQDHTKADRLGRAFARIDRNLSQDKADLEQEFNQRREELADRNAYIADNAMRLYKELRNLKKGVRASEQLGYLLDSGYEWSSIKSALVNISHNPNETVNINSGAEALAREMLGREYDDQVEGLDGEYAKRVAELEAGAKKRREEAIEEERKLTRKDLHQSIVDKVKARFAAKGYDFDSVLKKAKNLSTFSTVDNIPQRVMEKSLGYKEGQILSDMTVDQVARNETEGIKWLNSFTDRKNGVLASLSKKYGIKPGSKESAAAQMYAEGFYVNDANEIIQYGDAELAKDFPDAKVLNNIKGLAKDPVIRQIYDETLAAINESRTRNAYPEIQKLDNYFLHFRAMDDTFSRLGLPFNPNDIKAKDLPTDLNGVTADLKPGQPYFASAMHRKGMRTSFDLLGGLEKYLTSAKNQIYHIDDIQTLRALRNYIADTYGQANGLEGLDALTEEEAQEQIEKVYDSHLSTFAKFLNEEANVIAGKTALIDRGLEGIIGRRGITFLSTLNKQVGANMVGFNVSSSLTNFLAPVQAFAKTNKAAFVKGFAQTVQSKLGSIVGKTDAFVENNPTIIRRKGADSFYRTPFQKVGDAGYLLMSAVDNISTEVIVRAKYNELIKKGMTHDDAIVEADKWTSRLMGDRSLGQQPQLYNSKMLGILTKFQLEVRNQLDSQFYDTIKEAQVSNEDIKNAKARNAKTAAKIASTFFQLALGQHIFGKVFESIAGYNPAFDIISVLATALGWDDEDDSEDTALDNLEQGFMELLEDLPYTSTFTGGRIPIQSALPIEQFIKGEDQYGNEKSRWKTLGEAAPYYVLPGGYGQIKKTSAGLKMFSDDLPVAGSYTNSGNLRFPVEETPLNVAQAALFGQYANKNAREYFDEDIAPLGEKQIQEYQDLDLPISEYWDIRKGLKGLDKLEEKADYIDSLDLPIGKKNILINNIADRKEPIDMEDYGQYGSMEEFDYAEKNPKKYSFLKENGISYSEYKSFDDDTQNAWDWGYENPDKMSMAKAVAGDVVGYRQYTSALNDIKADKDSDGKTISGSRKEKVIEYLNDLDLDYGQKIILFRSQYSSQEDRDAYNADILEYLNSRDDISYEETVEILKGLDFTVTSDGSVYWD